MYLHIFIHYLYLHLFLHTLFIHRSLICFDAAVWNSAEYCAIRRSKPQPESETLWQQQAKRGNYCPTNSTYSGLNLHLNDVPLRILILPFLVSLSWGENSMPYGYIHEMFLQRHIGVNFRKVYEILFYGAALIFTKRHQSLYLSVYNFSPPPSKIVLFKVFRKKSLVSDNNALICYCFFFYCATHL